MSNKVTGAKPKIGGAIQRGTANATLPTSVSAPTTGFESLGYVSEEGLTNSNSPEIEEQKAWGGDTVLTVSKGRPDNFKFKLIETLKENVLKMVYGDNNVTGTLETGIAIGVDSADLPEAPYVIDMVLKNGILKRICIPHGKVQSIGEIQYANNAVGYEITLGCTADSSGKTHYEYIKAAGAGAAANNGGAD